MPESKDTVAQANDQLAGYVPLAIVVPAGFTKNSGKHKVGATEDNEPAWPLPAVATAMVCSKQVERRTSCGQGAEMQFHALRGVSALETRLMTSREPNGLWLLYRTRSRADINVPSLGYLRTESC